MWRDQHTPRQILEKLAKRHHWPEPIFYYRGASEDDKEELEWLRERRHLDSSDGPEKLWLLELDVNGSIYRYQDLLQHNMQLQSESDEQRTPAQLGPPDERLALYAMTRPRFEPRLLNEHVETRPLFNNLHPGIAQVQFLLVCYESILLYDHVIEFGTCVHRARSKCGSTSSLC